MDSFIEKLGDRIEKKRLRSQENRRIASDDFEKLIEILEKIVDAKAMFVNGQMFKIDLSRNTENQTVDIYLPNTIIRIENTGGHCFTVMWIPEVGDRRDSRRNFDGLDNFLEFLLPALSEKLENLGFLDKDIYPKKVQDTIGI